MSDRPRVVITGMGVISTLGEDLESYERSLFAGRSGIGNWRRQDARIESHIGGDMSGFSLEDHLAGAGSHYPPEMKAAACKLLRSTPRPATMTAVAALQAWTDAGLANSGIVPERVGHTCGGHNLGLTYLRENMELFEDEPEYIDPLFGVLSMDTDAVAATCELITTRGPGFLVGGACASGNLAILAALDTIRCGRADAMVVTGAPAVLDPIILKAWAMIDAISYGEFEDEPWRASRPFDARRRGFVPSEGSAALVLETEASARARGARIYAEVAGGSCNTDGCRLPKPSQEGQVRVITDALRDGRVSREEVGYVNAHATSTPLGDATEVGAIKNVFGSGIYDMPVNSTKSMIGHCLTAAGVMEMVATILQMNRGFVHPTINQEEKDTQLDLDFVPNRGREHRFDAAISNSFGFGGINSCLVVRNLQ